MKKRVFVLSLVGLVACSQAQLSASSSEFRYENLSNVSGTTYIGGTDVNLSSTSLVSTSTFDSVFKFPRQNSSMSLTMAYTIPLVVGPYPILYHSIVLSYQSSWIITGGGTTTIYPRVFASLREQIGENRNYTSDPLVASVTVNHQNSTGNGRYDLSQEFGWGRDIYLTPGKYYLDYGVGFYGTLTDFDSSDLTAGLTIEAGGPHTNGTYGGFTATVNYEVAPEPSTMLGLTSGLGLIAVLSRRRKK